VTDDLDAETVDVEPASLGGPVDPPDEHRTIYADVVQRSDEPLAPIVPAVWRNPDQRRQVLRWYAWYTGYKLRFHAVRSPKYAAKTALYAPRGAGRLVLRTVWWARAEEGNWQLRQHAASRNDAETWQRLDAIRERQSRWRWWVVSAVFLGLLIALVVMRGAAPLWLQALVLAGVVPVLARHGRPGGQAHHRPGHHRAAVHQAHRGDGPPGGHALGIARIKEPGDIDFPPPGIHRDGPGWLARFNLPAGVEAVAVLERRGRLSSALRLPVDQVWPTAGPEHAGQVDLWVGYAPRRRWASRAGRWLAPTARTSVFEPHEFGTDQRQRPVSTPLFARNFLIGGVPGSGSRTPPARCAIDRRAGPDGRVEDRRVQGHRGLHRPRPAVHHVRVRRRRHRVRTGLADPGVGSGRGGAARQADPGRETSAARRRRAR
jgi:S-DNA-T family DNA segregation ATPase FtsK/SpoIIIE